MRKAHNKLTQEQVINSFKEVHGDAFDYSKVVYVDTHTPVEVYCKKHNCNFKTLPKNHKKGSGCTQCGREAQIEKAKKPQKEFEKEIIDLYGEKYDLSKLEYRNKFTKVTLICDIHGEFAKAPDSILNGNACDFCCKKQTKSNDKGIFIEEAKKVYGDKDDYTDTEVISSKYKVKVRCTKHNIIFEKDIQSYLLGCGCPKCSAENYSFLRKKTTEQFVKEAKEVHENRFDYTNTTYISVKNVLSVTCKKHSNTFECYPDNHLKVKSGGCKKCHSEYISKKFKGREGTCGYTKSAYIKQAKGKECRVYFIRCWDDQEEFYKIGKTFLDINIRFKKSNMPYSFTEVDSIKGEAGFIYDLENELHRQYKSHKYRPEEWFAGYTECYKISLPIEEIVKNYE